MSDFHDLVVQMADKAEDVLKRYTEGNPQTCIIVTLKPVELSLFYRALDNAIEEYRSRALFFLEEEGISDESIHGMTYREFLNKSIDAIRYAIFGPRPEIVVLTSQ